MHALWQPEDSAGRQRRPHAAEHDDDECGATALMEGVGATDYGRFDATAPGKVRLGPHRAAAPRKKDRTLGGGSKTVVPLHFWCRAINAGGQATREIDTGLRRYVLTYEYLV